MLTFLKGLYDKAFGGGAPAPKPAAPSPAPKAPTPAGMSAGPGGLALDPSSVSLPKAPAPAPKAPAAPVVSSAVAPTIQRLQSQAGTPASTPVAQNFAVDTTTKTTSDQLKQSSRGGLEQKRSDLDRQLAKLREPSREQLRAQEQLARAEQALANVTAGQTARLADLQYYNPEGVFGGGVAAREGQINRESTLQAIQAQGSLSAAQSAYDRLSQARQQEIENLRTFQSMTMPEVLGTPTVNKATGEVTAYIQRADGTVGVESIGNVGPDASFDLQTVIRNEATGQAFAVGTRNGELVAEPLAGTAGLAPRATGGGIYGGLSLTAGQETDIADTNTLVSMIDAAEASFKQGGGSGVGGLGYGSIAQFFAKNFGVGSPQEIQLRNQIGNIAGTIAKLRGGTSFTDSEKALLETYSPTINDSAVVAEQKLKDLRSFLITKRASLLGVAGGDYLGELPATDSDPLGLGI